MQPPRLPRGLMGKQGDCLERGRYIWAPVRHSRRVRMESKERGKRMSKFDMFHRYTKDALKALRKAERIICHRVADGILVATPYVIYKMSLGEYDTYARPVTWRDPGEWRLVKQGATFAERNDPNAGRQLEDIWDKAMLPKGAGRGLVETPVRDLSLRNTPKAQAYKYYCAEDLSFAMAVNEEYIRGVNADMLCSAGSERPIVACWDKEPYAILMPLRPRPACVRAALAFVDEDGGIARLKKEIEKKNKLIAALSNAVPEGLRDAILSGED